MTTKRPRTRLSARIGHYHAATGSHALGPQRHGVLLLVTHVDGDDPVTSYRGAPVLRWIPSTTRWDPTVRSASGALGAYVDVIREDAVREAALALIAEHGVTEQRDRRLEAMGVPLI